MITYVATQIVCIYSVVAEHVKNGVVLRER